MECQHGGRRGGGGGCRTMPGEQLGDGSLQGDNGVIHASAHMHDILDHILHSCHHIKPKLCVQLLAATLLAHHAIGATLKLPKWKVVATPLCLMFQMHVKSRELCLNACHTCRTRLLSSLNLARLQVPLCCVELILCAHTLLVLVDACAITLLLLLSSHVASIIWTTAQSPTIGTTKKLSGKLA